MEMRSIDVVSISPLLVGSGIATRKQKERPFASLLIGSCIATEEKVHSAILHSLFQSPTHRVMHCNLCFRGKKPSPPSVSVPYSSGHALQPQVAQNCKTLVHKGCSHPDDRSKKHISPKMVILHNPPLNLRKLYVPDK